MNKSDSREHSITLLDVLEIILKWKKTIAIIVIIATISGVVLAFCLPGWYYSYTSVKASNPLQYSPLSGIGTGNPIEQFVGGFSNLGFLAGSSELNTFIKILQSRKVMSEIIRKFKLMEIYGTEYIDEAIEILKENTLFKLDIESNILFIGVYDKDPQRAANMANHFMVLLNNINVELNTTRARNIRTFIEARYTETLANLHNAEDSLKKFKKIHGIYFLEEQAKQAINALANLQAELTIKQVQLGVIEHYLQEEHAELLQLKKEIDELEGKVNEFYHGSREKGKKNERVFIPLVESPELGQIYFRLFREVKIQEKLTDVLLPLFEKAKIEEKQNTPTLLVLDEAFIPEKESKPKRSLIVIGFIMAGMVFAFGYIVTMERLNYLKMNKPDVYLKINQIASRFRFPF